MIIEVKVIPGAKKNLLVEVDGFIKVYLTTPPVEGKANKALIKFLSKHYQVAAGYISIIKGLKSRHKVINIDGL